MGNALKKILYVEDDEVIAEITKMALREIGQFDVLHCTNGQSALESFDKYKPDLVLLDVMMPEMDGPETLNQLRKQEGKENIVPVFMTAKAQKHEQKAYLEMGAIGVIVKPFDPITLSQELVQIWKSRNDK